VLVEAVAATCPDTFTVCAPPQRGLGFALLFVPMLGSLLSLLGGAILLRRAKVRRPAPPFWLVLAGSLAAVVAHEAIVPSGPVVYYDEFLHAETTTNLATQLNPHPCCGYAEGRCQQGGPIEWPLATHLTSAAVMKVTGGSDVQAGMVARQRLNRFASFVAPLLAFSWVSLLVPDALAALLVALALALWPGAIRLQTTADLTPGAVLFLLLLLIAVELDRRRPSWGSTLTTVGLLAVACHTRLEMALVLPWILWRSPRKLILLAATPFILAPLVWLYVEGRSSTIGWSPDLTQQLVRHLPLNLSFLLSARGALPGLALLTLIGATRRDLLPLLATALGLLLFISTYTFGEFRPDADGFRYANVIVVLLLPLAAAGAHAVLARASAPRPMICLMLAAAVVGPVAAQRSILTQTNPVAALDHLIESSSLRSLHPKTIVTRSVAYARARTDAPNIVERCTEGGFDHLLETGPLYLRTWGDVGPEPYRYGCSEWIPGTVGASPDGQGPWLHYWDLSCHQD
jgi:hypothetical protein